MDRTGSAALKQAKLGTFTVKIRVTIVMPHRPGMAVRIAAEPTWRADRRRGAGFFCAARVRHVAADRPGGNLICLLRRRCRTM